VLQQSDVPNDDAQVVRDDSRSEIVGLEDAETTENSKESLLAIEAVKLGNGRCDLWSVLRDEVEMATGRMSINGQSSSPHSANCNDSNSVSSMWLAGDSSIRSWCSSVPSV
jgi:hypothetical protein